MDERTLRAMLALLDASAPEGYTWHAEAISPFAHDPENGLDQHIRMWLVENDSRHYHEEGLVWA